MAPVSVLPIFLRDKDAIKIAGLDPHRDEGVVQQTQYDLPKVQVKVATWSPDGGALAFVDPSQGVCVLDLSQAEDGKESCEVLALAGSSKSTQGLFWSPMSTSLVTIAMPQKGSAEPNLQIWRKNGSGGCESGGGTGEFLRAASFVHPKLAPDREVVKWTKDETLCLRICPDGVLHIYDGAELAGTPQLQLQFSRGVQNVEFARLRPRGNLRARMSAFVPDARDDLQRVAAPAEVSVLEVNNAGNGKVELEKVEKVTADVTSGQMSELKWCASGSAVLALCTTEVDDSGKSYYGGSKLLLLSHDGKYQKDLTETDTTATSGVSVQAVEWSPTRDEFILIRGFQPAQVTLWSWDSKAQTATLVKILCEKAHRNTIRFNHFGSLVCIAGFGNLAGDVDFYGRSDDERCEYSRVASCTANCTVSAEWAPDGRHLLTAVLFPRMRVDNGLSVWRALTGQKVVETQIEELYEVSWRPENPSSLRFLDVSVEEVERASQGSQTRDGAGGAGAKKQAYRPPKARGGNEGTSSVAAMMRGEVAAPESDDRRGRRPWQLRAKDEEQQPASSPILGPSADPVPPSSPSERRNGASPEKARMTSKDGAPSPSPPNSRPPPPPEPVPTAPWQQLQREETTPAKASAGAQASSPPAATSLSKANAADNAVAAALAAAGATAPNVAAMLANSGSVAAAAAARQQLERRQLEAQLERQQQLEQIQQLQQQRQMEAAMALIAQQQQQQKQLQQQQLLQQRHFSEQLAATQLLAAQRQQAQQVQEVAAMAAALSAAQQRGQAQAAQAAAATRAAAAAAAVAGAGYPKQVQPQAPQRQAQKAQIPADKRPCPATGWQYVDPKGKVQGPFTLLEMQLWNSMGYFRADLPMRFDPADPFVELNKLFPPPLVPFESYPRCASKSS